MEAEARYTFVGAAVLVLLGALVAALLWLSNAGGRGDFNAYAIYFESQALDGLQVGAEVNLRGIKVGRVRDYALAHDRLNRVRVEVDIDRRVPVRTSTVAVVTRNFVTGIAAIALVNREPAGEPLTEAGKGDKLPVIAEGQSNLDQLTGRVSQVGEQASNALNSITQLLTEQNRKEAMDTVRSVRELSTGLIQRLSAVDRVLAQAGRSLAAVGAAVGQLSQSGERIAAVAEAAGGRLDTTLTETEHTLRDTRSALARMASAVDDLDRQTGATARRLEDSAGQVEDQLGAATAELRLSIEATTRVLDRLRDPRAALLGPSRQQLGPGEVKP